MSKKLTCLWYFAVARRAFFSLLLTDSRRLEVARQCYPDAETSGVADIFRRFTGNRHEDLYAVCEQQRPAHIEPIIATRQQHFKQLRSIVVHHSDSESAPEVIYAFLNKCLY